MHETSTALLVGNYLHTYFESPMAHTQFIEDNKSDIISKSGKTVGQPKAPFKQAELMIQALDNDDFFKAVYKGDKEVPLTGEIDGLAWRGKLDCLNIENGYFVDLKTVDDIHKKHWNSSTRTWDNFIFDRQYIMQMAVYRELLKQKYGHDFEAFIFAVSKQDQPDKMAVRIDDYRYEEALEPIYRLQHRFEAVKNGEQKPDRCEQCDYCRMTKQLSGFVEVGDINVD